MTATITVGFPLYPGCTLLDFAGATQIFAFSDGFAPVWIAAERAPIPTTEGVTVNPNATFDDHPPLSILFVPGGGDSGVGAAMRDPVLQAWLKREAASAEWVGRCAPAPSCWPRRARSMAARSRRTGARGRCCSCFRR